MGDKQIRLFELLYLNLLGRLGTDLTPPCLMNSDLHLNMTDWHHPGTHKFRSWEPIKRPFVAGTTVKSTLAARHHCDHWSQSCVTWDG